MNQAPEMASLDPPRSSSIGQHASSKLSSRRDACHGCEAVAARNHRRARTRRGAPLGAHHTERRRDFTVSLSLRPLQDKQWRSSINYPVDLAIQTVTANDLSRRAVSPGLQPPILFLKPAVQLTASQPILPLCFFCLFLNTWSIQLCRRASARSREPFWCLKNYKGER